MTQPDMPEINLGMIMDTIKEMKTDSDARLEQMIEHIDMLFGRVGNDINALNAQHLSHSHTLITGKPQ
jgi:archaellum component FlaC